MGLVITQKWPTSEIINEDMQLCSKFLLLPDLWLSPLNLFFNLIKAYLYFLLSISLIFLNLPLISFTFFAIILHSFAPLAFCPCLGKIPNSSLLAYTSSPVPCWKKITQLYKLMPLSLQYVVISLPYSLCGLSQTCSLNYAYIFLILPLAQC